MEEGLKNTNIPSLAAWAGGGDKFERLTEAFYKKVRADALLGPVFQDMSAEHAQRVAHFLVEVLGGQKLYTGKDHGSHASMVEHHIGRKLTEQHRKRWMQLLLETADDIGLPDDPEFRSAFVGYIEWGTRIAVLNSNAHDNPIKPGEPMPKWGWGETGGPYQG
jgi:hemoglobin